MTASVNDRARLRNAHGISRRRIAAGCIFAMLRYRACTGTYPQIPMDDPDLEAMRRRLAELKMEHRDLDDVIARLSDKQPFDLLQMQRLKKRKLMLKDQIARLESKLLPDIIA